MDFCKYLGLVAVALLVVPVAGANSIDASIPGTGLGGTNHALKCLPDGLDDKAFVEADEPTAETIFSVEFRILVETALRDDMELLRVMDIAVAFGNNVPSRNLKFGFQRAKYNPVNHRFRVYARNNDTGKLRPYVVFNFAPGTDTLVKIEWQAASAPGANDGIVRVYKNGTLKSERTDIPSDGQDVERIRFGLPVGSVNTGATGAGSFYLDEFVLTRTISP